MGNELPRELLDDVMALDEGGKRALAQALKEMIATELMIARGGAAPTRCPHCGGEHIVKKGKDRAGKQRYLCKQCGRTFGASTLSVIGQTKLATFQWVGYADRMAEGWTLRELAQEAMVCLKTSWFMRMRLLEAMGKHLDEFRSGPGVSVEVDGTMLHESFKGNNKKSPFELPRRPHKSGKSLHVRGVSGQQVCVLCAANDRGDVYASILGRAHGNTRLINAKLGGLIDPGTHVATDDLRPYSVVVPGLGCEHEVRPSKPESGGKALGMVNEAHKRLKDFLRPFHGVCTRRLGRYLNWFMWEQQFRGSDASRWDLMSREALTGDYDHSRAATFAEPRFDMDWWSGKALLTS